MEQELQEMIFDAYLKLCDSACTEIRNLKSQYPENQKSVMDAMREKTGFLIEIGYMENIASLTQRYQNQCKELLESALKRLGIESQTEFVEIIRNRMSNVFGLEQ